LSLYRPFHRVGLVNRGEPAVRFLRAARAWTARRGEPLEVVAFYTEPDRESQFVLEADAAVSLGEALVAGPDGKRRSAYLDINRIVGLLREEGCDAAWPGWGFVSENPEFAEALATSGIVFLGPPASAMRLLSDKIAAKHLAQKHGVPVTPWSEGPVATVAEAQRHAARIGFPVMLKAAAGGGGRGIRIVPSAGDLEALFASAATEALTSFGDGTLLLEGLVPEARHIEVQILADSHGHTYALGTRDCSMQRRHQKLIEEAPAPHLTPAMTRALEEAATTIARACGYVSAGTAEFLVRPDGDGFVFLEMNARLQVEHPVTESITGVDLVDSQIAVARGEVLALDHVRSRGHAIEVRLNAEDPDERFTPTAGRLLRFDVPQGPGLRVESGFATGAVIPSEFDSMLAKVIATGATREEARARLAEALSRFTVAIEGGASNRSLLLELLDHDVFREGVVTTRWLDRHLGERSSALDRRHLEAALVCAAISEYEQSRRGDVLNFLKEAHRGAVPATPPLAEPRTFRFHVGGQTASIEAATIGPRRYRLSDGKRSLTARFEYTDRSTGVLNIFGQRYTVVLVRTAVGISIEVDGVAHRFTRASDGRVVAPVPAAVTFVHVRPGDVVKAGERLVTLEVMKMELALDAPLAGRIAKLFVDGGSRVSAGDAVAIIEGDPETAQHESAALEPFERLTGSRPLADWNTPIARLRGALLGYDLPAGIVESAIRELREDASPASSELLQLLEIYVTREHLFERGAGPDGVAPTDHFAHYLRLPRARGAGLPDEFLANMRRALASYEVRDLNVGPVLESALLRLAQAHRTRNDQDSILFAVLAALDRRAGGEPAAPATRPLLEALAALASGRHPRLTDAAWAALYVLCDRPEHPPATVTLSEAVIAEELARFTQFNLERLEAPSEVYLTLARAKDDVSDERLICLVEIDHLYPRTPGFEREYLIALHAMRQAVAQLKGAAKLVWNRLHVSVRQPLLAERTELQRSVTRLALPAAGLGLERIVVRGVTDEARPIFIEWSAPTGHGAAVAIADTGEEQVTPLSAYERRVVEARRRGLFYPYELVRLLTGGAPDGPLPPGIFDELDLDAIGDKLRTVRRPLGGNRANLVVGLIENRFAPFDDGIRRVLIIGDPTRGMGALSEAECRRVIAAFDLAEAQRLPVEWVPVSSGAKIAWDSGTENLDWTAAVLARIVRFTQAGGVVNIIVDGVCVGAQSYWNAEATMLMHCKGTLVMTPRGSMLLTGKRALEFAGSVAAEDNQGIGGFERIMGPNGEAQYFAPDLVSAYRLLFRHYTLTHLPPEEATPRRLPSADPVGRDITLTPYLPAADGFTTIGDIFDETANPGRKRPFAIRALMRAVVDQDVEPLERWASHQGAETAVVWESSLGGVPACCIGIESKPLRRFGERRADGPEQWTAGTLFPLSSKKIARALWSASGVRPVVVLANLSGFDGSPESLRNLQLEHGAQIGRAVVNFRGPLVFCIVSRYHGGAYVVFSRALNPSLDAVALEGSYASVIGGAPAAAVVFPGLIKQRSAADPEVAQAREALDRGSLAERTAAEVRYEQVLREAQSRAQGAIGREFDAVHTVERARQVGSIGAILNPHELRADLIRRIGG
jgi:acetyl/propionyl-CoA carboxylase alpha subunit/acetyl-CoA carboxylase carboxyltransferase component